MERTIFDNISPLDYRYWEEEAANYLSAAAFIKYKLMVEAALVKVLVKRGLCSEKAGREIEDACKRVTAEEVYAEEKRIGHDIRALVNCICSKISEEAKPYVHLFATSYDIVDTANALRYRDVVQKVFLPSLLDLERTLIEITEREADTIQVGRTHGQHAVPITFGFAISWYVSRLGGSIEVLQELSNKLKGKFSGGTGAYNAASLIIKNPEEFEKEVMRELELEPGDVSTQIVQPEPLGRLLYEVVIAGGIMANLSDDMRHLQRTEIGEVGEPFEKEQVGSSTMPHKRNPINFENVKSFWKIIVPRILTVLMDQISEHQRDLSNSASGRTYAEIIAYATGMAKRLNRIMQKLQVDPENLKKNFEMQKDFITAEPLYIILASLGYPDAYEKVRQLTLKAEEEKRALLEAAKEDEELKPYFEKMTSRHKKFLSEPAAYTGIAAQKAKAVAKYWRERLKL